MIANSTHLDHRFAAPSNTADSTDVRGAAAVPGHGLQGVLASLAGRIGRGSQGARDLYLAQAADAADFERREQAWEAHEKRMNSLPLAL